MEHRIRSVDAVILTHGHADAIAGLGQYKVSSHEQCIVLASQPLADCQSLLSLYSLSSFPFSNRVYYPLLRTSADDLRAFNQPSTPGGPKPPPLPIHLSQQTLNAISEQYPYLVDKNRATGGGDVPTLDWRVWGDEWSEDEGDDDEGKYGGQEEIMVAGVRVLPLKGGSRSSVHGDAMKRGKGSSIAKRRRELIKSMPAGAMLFGSQCIMGNTLHRPKRHNGWTYPSLKAIILRSLLRAESRLPPPRPRLLSRAQRAGPISIPSPPRSQQPPQPRP